MNEEEKTRRINAFKKEPRTERDRYLKAMSTNPKNKALIDELDLDNINFTHTQTKKI